MEAPKPIIMITKNEIKEVNLISFELENNKSIYSCDLKTIDDENIRIIVVEKNNKLNRYENILSLNDFIKINKYFKMFDSLKELGEDLIGIIKEKKIEIGTIKNDNMVLKFEILARNNNTAYINLPKGIVEEKDKYNN